MKKRKKLFNFIFTCFFTLAAIFFLVRLAPGDPIERILGPEATFEEIEVYRKDLGLDVSLTQQFKNFFTGFIKGDLGSVKKQYPKPNTQIKNNLAITLFT